MSHTGRGLIQFPGPVPCSDPVSMPVTLRNTAETRINRKSDFLTMSRTLDPFGRTRDHRAASSASTSSVVPSSPSFGN